MTDLVVDPAPFLSHQGEQADGPLVPMVVSLTFPGMNQGARDLQDELTRIAFDAVRAAGGRPRLVDAAAPTLTDTANIFAGAAAIVILGGGDVDGACYGLAGPARNEYGVDRRADDYCLDIIRQAVEIDLPTLAICRGSQLLNVAFGGTLIPDITDFALHHGAPGSPLFLDEDVVLAPDSKIAQMLGRTEVTVRNGHHQAVGDVAPALRTTATAHDGIVEGTEHREASWVVGVQWHPEEPQANLEDRAKIFGALVEQAVSVQQHRRELVG